MYYNQKPRFLFKTEGAVFYFPKNSKEAWRMKPDKKNVRIYNKFQYHIEDADCKYCLYYKGKVRGCTLTACSCEDIRLDAIANGRIKRERGAV